MTGVSRNQTGEPRHSIITPTLPSALCSLSIYGAGALAALELTSDETASLSLRDVQNLLLWVLSEEAGEMPRWVIVRNKPLIRGAVLVIAPGMSMAEICPAVRNHQQPPVASSKWVHPLPLRLPRANRERLIQSIAGELLQVKVSKKRKSAGGEPASMAPAPARPANDVPDAEAVVGEGLRKLLPDGRWSFEYVESFALSELERKQNSYPPHLYLSRSGSAFQTADYATTVPPPHAGVLADAEAGHGCAGAFDGATSATHHGVAASHARAAACGPGTAACVLSVDCEMCYAQGAHRGRACMWPHSPRT